MKKPVQHPIAEVPRRQAKVEITIGIDLGDVWSHYCTLNQDGEVVDRGRFRTTPKAMEKWFTDVPPARVAMEAGTHSIWISEQLQELGHEVIVANVRELRAISPPVCPCGFDALVLACPHRLSASANFCGPLCAA